mmetsp:Transcript_42892/g.133937  ORF Transcript_42892/g.133937 Transcript_42892/m.133937 type:complete len:256 (+) Transcript_42892:327-1094(+)
MLRPARGEPQPPASSPQRARSCMALCLLLRQLGHLEVTAPFCAALRCSLRGQLHLLARGGQPCGCGGHLRLQELPGPAPRHTLHEPQLAELHARLLASEHDVLPLAAVELRDLVVHVGPVVLVPLGLQVAGPDEVVQAAHGHRQRQLVVVFVHVQQAALWREGFPGELTAAELAGDELRCVDGVVLEGANVALGDQAADGLLRNECVAGVLGPHPQPHAARAPPQAARRGPRPVHGGTSEPDEDGLRKPLCGGGC